MATECGLKAADFTTLHSNNKTFCSTIVVSQLVYCTYRILPDITPPQAASDIRVFNLKGVIGESYDKSQDLLNILKVLQDISSLDSQLNIADIANPAVVPVLTMASAVAGRGRLSRRQLESQSKSETLFFIPSVAEAVDSSIVTIRSALSIAYLGKLSSPPMSSSICECIFGDS